MPEEKSIFITPPKRAKRGGESYCNNGLLLIVVEERMAISLEHSENPMYGFASSRKYQKVVY